MTATPEKPPEASSAPPPTALRMQGISKRFGAFTALSKVDFSCQVGEVHALIGENGAGKSTLMKILGGAQSPDEGQIELFGRRVTFRHPVEAQTAGVSVIHQEFNLLPHRTVAQNIFLGREPHRFGVIDRRAQNAAVTALLTRLGISASIHPDDLVADLSVAQQQMVEIAKALSYDARLLIMDEPTAALANQEVDALLSLIANLKEQGMTIIYISHRFPEIFSVADRVTVLKDGAIITTRDVGEVTVADLVRLMVGRDLSEYYPPRANPGDLGEVVLSVKSAGNAKLRNISFQVRAGEVLGIAGLQGAGRSELAQALFGVDPFTYGEVQLHGRRVHSRSPRQAIGHGLGFVTEDRKGLGLALRQPIADNVALARRGRRPLLSLVSSSGSRSGTSVEELTKSVDLRSAGLHQEAQFLSGGNQQKVVLAKWLALDGSLTIYDEPTRGIDVNGKASIHQLIRDSARRGKAVIMISSDLLEVIGMSDRILVMRFGEVAGELAAGATEEQIMLLATHGGEA